MTEPILREIIAELRRQNVLVEKPLPTIEDCLNWFEMAIDDDLRGAANAYYGDCAPVIRALLVQEAERRVARIAQDYVK